jgi:PPM family protein phosphatase
LVKLASVLEALKEAAVERKWTIDWTQVESVIQEATAARSRGDLKAATVYHAQAIVETMAQLRTQNRRASDTTIVSDRH